MEERRMDRTPSERSARFKAKREKFLANLDVSPASPDTTRNSPPVTISVNVANSKTNETSSPPVSISSRNNPQDQLKRPNNGQLTTAVGPTVDRPAGGQLSSSAVDRRVDVIYDEPSSSSRVDVDIVKLINSDGYVKRPSEVVFQRQQSAGNKETSAVRTTSCSSSSFVQEKPTVSDVRLLLRRSGGPAEATGKLGKPAPLGRRTCRSSESIDRLDFLLDFSISDRCPNDSRVSASGSGNNRTLRSSFLDPDGPPTTRKSVYIELGDYQTLLKHSRNDADAAECLYSLPQPQCYGEDTLRAVKLITDKYDTFKRRQLRSLSFRDGTITVVNRKSSPEESGDAAVFRRWANDLRRKSIITVGDSNTVAPPASAKGERNNNNDNRAGHDGAWSSQRRNSTITAAAGREEKDTSEEVESRPASQRRPCSESSVPDPLGNDSRTKRATSDPSALLDYCNALQVAEDDDDDGPTLEGDGGLSKVDRLRIELFYRSREATIFVCGCLADLSTGETTTTQNDRNPRPATVFARQHTGVPVWLLNSGAGIRRRELLLVLSERETGLPLWQDKINYLSNYEEVSARTHSLRVSGSLRKMVRLEMSCQKSAEAFLKEFHRLTSDPQDDLWKMSSSCGDSRRSVKAKFGSNGKKGRGRSRRGRLPSKSSISQPCKFAHVSGVDPNDPDFRAAFADLIPIPIPIPIPISISTPIFVPMPENDSNETTPRPGNDDRRPEERLPRGDVCKNFEIVGPNCDEFSDSTSSPDVCEFRPRLPTS